METVCSKFVVYYDEPFWVGLIERREHGRLEVARHVFGPEPSEAEIADFVLTRWRDLRFSPAVEDKSAERKLKPKRMHRQIKRQAEQPACGTRAQQALQLQREENKQAAADKAKQRREEEKELQFQLRQARKKEKHKGH